MGLSHCQCKQALLFHQSQAVYPPRHYGKPILRDRIRLWAVKKRIKSCLKAVNLVFCQTPVIRKRFSTVMNYPIEQIKLMPNAVSEYAKQATEPARPAVFDVSPEMFNLFFLAKYMPHKNIEVLLELFTCFPEQLKNIRCIITVQKEQNKKAKLLLEKIKKYKLDNHIVNVGLLKQEELAGYFCHCDALFFPTLLESFSGTYLEAMHFGLPILTSDLDFAHYVCGDAAIYFNPWNPQAIVDAIGRVQNSENVRQELIQKGKQRFLMFFKPWEQIILEMLRETFRQ
jgi:glycosyltransferase involved in cell wall biosynthesis